MVQSLKSSRCKNRNQWLKESFVEQEEATPKETPPRKNKKGKKKVKFPCLACKEEDHFTRDYPYLVDIQKFVEQSKNPTLAMLTNPFPAQHQQLVAQVPVQQPAPQSVATPSRAGSSSVHIMMADTIDLATRAKSCEKQPEGEPSTHADSPSQPQSNGPITFEKPTFEAPSHPSKGTLRFPFPWKICVENHTNTQKIIFDRFFHRVSFAFPYWVIHSWKTTKCFCLAFALVKHISKWDRGSLYKFHPRKKLNALSDLASFHARKRIWISILTV